MENGQSVFFLRACEARASKTLTPHFADFLLILRKKPTVLQSRAL